MDNSFVVMMIILFIVAPIVERALKGGRSQKRPPQRPGQPGMPPPPGRQLPRNPTEARQAPPDDGEVEQDATGLVPADLWEILTGQRQLPVPEPPKPAPEPLRPAPPPLRTQARRASPPVGQSDEAKAVAELMRQRERRRIRDRTTTHVAPEIVSLETEPLSETRRHTAFHDKLDTLSAPARVEGKAAMVAIDLDFEDNASLRRAILLQEILGPPRGLD